MLKFVKLLQKNANVKESSALPACWRKQAEG
jgi:hypothetical protein